MNDKYKSMLKRFGLVGFLFFLLKGLAWLFLGGSLVNWMCNNSGQ